MTSLQHLRLVIDNANPAPQLFRSSFARRREFNQRFKLLKRNEDYFDPKVAEIADLVQEKLKHGSEAEAQNVYVPEQITKDFGKLAMQALRRRGYKGSYDEMRSCFTIYGKATAQYP